LEQVAALVASLAASPVLAAGLSAQGLAECSAALASQASSPDSLAQDAYPASQVSAADSSALGQAEYLAAPASQVSFLDWLAQGAYPAS
jgi:hypothetical protein